MKDAKAILYNSLGQRMKELEHISGTSFTISKDDFPNGLYFIKIIENSNTIVTEKFIITDN
jgi:hypothetical protein